MRHPEFYYGRAEETRIMAKATIDPESRKTLIQRAAEYEDLAKLATTPKKVKNSPIRSSSEDLSTSQDKCRYSRLKRKRAAAEQPANGRERTNSLRGMRLHYRTPHQNGARKSRRDRLRERLEL
jgi:hypothetical protein